MEEFNLESKKLIFNNNKLIFKPRNGSSPNTRNWKTFFFQKRQIYNKIIYFEPNRRYFPSLLNLLSPFLYSTFAMPPFLKVFLLYFTLSKLPQVTLLFPYFPSPAITFPPLLTCNTLLHVPNLMLSLIYSLPLVSLISHQITSPHLLSPNFP